MKKEIFKRSPLRVLVSSLASCLVAVVIFVFISFCLTQAESASHAEATRILEESLMRATIKCYAIEGFYPENVSYLTEYYGVSVDKTKYAVHYQIFASNILPDITVVELRRR